MTTPPIPSANPSVDESAVQPSVVTAVEPRLAELGPAGSMLAESTLAESKPAESIPVDLKPGEVTPAAIESLSHEPAVPPGEEIAGEATADHEFLSRILEAALLAAGDSLSLQRMESLFDEAAAPPASDLVQALALLKARSQGHGFELVEVASGWRLQVREEFAPWVNRLWDEKPQKYSRALLETLALIAYRQPITRGDIEDVRGVAVSSHIIKTLAEREWIKVVGTRDVPGRPSLYATTRHFLDYFNLRSLEDLPTLSELKDIDNLNQSLDLVATELEGQLTREAEQIADAQADEEKEITGNATAEPPQLKQPDNLTLFDAATGVATDSPATTENSKASDATEEDLTNV